MDNVCNLANVKAKGGEPWANEISRRFRGNWFNKNMAGHVFPGKKEGLRR